MEIPLTDWHEHIETHWTVKFDMPWLNNLISGEISCGHGGVNLYWSKFNGKSLGFPSLTLEDAQAAVLSAALKEAPPEFANSLGAEWKEDTQTLWTLPCIEHFLRIKIWKEGNEYKGTINDREVRTYESLEMAKSQLLGSLFLIVSVSYDQVKAMIDPEYRKGIDEFNEAQSGR
jgi:hypothetical protein